MKKRFISTVLCAAMAASLVTGCGSGSGNASGGSTQAAADTGSKKEVVIWDYFETDAQKAMMTTLLDGSTHPRMNTWQATCTCLSLIMRNS